MMVTKKLFCLGSAIALAAVAAPVSPTTRPSEFVNLSDVDPSILIEMRYFGPHNFIGRRIAGYKAPKCLVTRPTAERLKALQTEIKEYQLTLKMYDCYRSQIGVNDFITWSRDVKDQKMKAEFYPRIDKRDVFKLGYVAEKSGHSRGSTVDLTLVSLPAAKQPEYRDGEKLRDCAAARSKRYADNTLEMGTGYDCFDAKASTADASAGVEALRNKLLLKSLMEKHGFANYAGEWWHYTLKDEPFPDTYFEFDVE